MLAHRFPLAVQLAYNWSTSYGRAEGGEEGLISRGGGGGSGLVTGIPFLLAGIRIIYRGGL